MKNLNTGDGVNRANFGRLIADEVASQIERFVAEHDYEIGPVIADQLIESQTMIYSAAEIRQQRLPGLMQQGPISGADAFVVKTVRWPIEGDLRPGGVGAAASAQRASKVVELDLYAAGRPYVTAADRALDCRNEYRVMAAPDTPPYMVNVDAVGRLPRSEVLAFEGAKAAELYMDETIARVLGREAIHYLSDRECETVVTGVKNAYSDISIGGLYQYFED